MSSDTKRIKLSSEELIPIPEEHCNDHLVSSAAVDIVFQTPEIVEKICHLLDFRSLKECRKVSKLWMTEATKPALRKYSIRVPSWYKLGNKPPYYRSQMNLPWERLRKQQHKAAVHQLLSLKHPNMLINLVISSSEEVEIFFDYDFNFLLSKVRKLVYESSCRENMENLHKLLQKMPNLQILTTSSLDLSSDQIWLQKDQNLDNFLSKLESLKEIKTTFEPTSIVFNSWMTYRNKLKAIKKFRNPEHQMMSSLLLSGQRWNIQKLTLNVDTKTIEPKLLVSFFSSISDCLEHLSIRFMSGLDPSEYPWDDTCHEPLKLLGKLKKLKMYCFSRHPSDHLAMRRKGLAVALKFPFITSLDISLDGYNVPLDLDTQVPFVFEKPSESLTELTFHVTGKESHNICSLENLHQQFYPKLKVFKLRIELFHKRTPETMRRIFENMRNVRRLVLRIAEDCCKGLLQDNSPVDARQRIGRWEREPDGQVNWDEILTGVPRPPVGMEDDEEHVGHVPTMRDLENLTSLKIINVSSCPLSDYLIYNGLVHLKDLQSLVIQGHVFSAKAIKNLRDSLAPTAHLSVHENPPYRKCNYKTPTGGVGESTSRLFL